MKIRAHVLIYGDVQGVFFSSSIRNEARVRGLTGWVKNNSNRSVEAVFEGEQRDVEGVAEFCKRGPKQAVIERVDIEWLEYTGEFEQFDIMYEQAVE